MASEPWPEYDTPLTRGDAVALIRDAATRSDAGSLAALLDAPLVRGDLLLRRRIVNALIRLHDPISAEALVRIVEEVDDPLRVSALTALARIGDRRLVPLFIETLEGDKHQARIRAIWGLSESRANEAIVPLIAALDDPSPSIKAAAAAALANIGDPMAIPPLREAKRRAWRPWRRYGLWIELKLLEEKNPRG